VEDRNEEVRDEIMNSEDKGIGVPEGSRQWIKNLIMQKCIREEFGVTCYHVHPRNKIANIQPARMIKALEKTFSYTKPDIMYVREVPTFRYSIVVPGEDSSDMKFLIKEIEEHIQKDRDS
jgi:hypothetical protein